MAYRDPAAAEPVRFLSMYSIGGRLTVYYTLPEIEDQVFRARLYPVDGGALFYSVSRASEIGPVMLASIRFYETREEAEAAGVTACVSTEHLDSDEPDWVWAVVTSELDGLQYSFQRASMSGENAGAMEALIGAKLPDRVLSSGTLDQNESVALEVNLAWYPRLRLELTREYAWGEYWFGQENWNPVMELDTPRYVTGHDLDGEGRGCTPLSEEELVNVLTGPCWMLTDETDSDILACLQFMGDSEADIILRETWYSMHAEYFRLNAKEGEAPDAVRLTAEPDALEELLGPQNSADAIWLGDYAILLTQLPGQQLLTLQQIGEAGGLGLLLPGTGETEQVFCFRRYRGTTPYTPMG